MRLNNSTEIHPSQNLLRFSPPLASIPLSLYPSLSISSQNTTSTISRVPSSPPIPLYSPLFLPHPSHQPSYRACRCHPNRNVHPRQPPPVPISPSSPPPPRAPLPPLQSNEPIRNEHPLSLRVRIRCDSWRHFARACATRLGRQRKKGRQGRPWPPFQVDKRSTRGGGGG